MCKLRVKRIGSRIRRTQGSSWANHRKDFIAVSWENHRKDVNTVVTRHVRMIWGETMSSDERVTWGDARIAKRARIIAIAVLEWMLCRAS